MNHSFDVDIAKKYGINCAIILEYLNFWIAKNKANEKNFHEGTYWTYNSVKAFNQLFPYLSPRQIATALQKLEAEGLIITGNFNEFAYDRTKWYAITEKGESILQNCIMDSTKCGNGFCDNGEPIPVNKPVANTVDKPIIIEETPKIPFEKIKSYWNEKNADLGKVRDMTTNRKDTIRARVKNSTVDDIFEAIDIVADNPFFHGSNGTGWKANFDWIFNETKFNRILEHFYDNCGNQQSKPKEEPAKQPETEEEIYKALGVW